MKPHNSICLQVDEELDTQKYVRKCYSVWGLRLIAGGRRIISDPKSYGVCGKIDPAHRVDRSQLERVTCNMCKEYIAKFVK